MKAIWLDRTIFLLLFCLGFNQQLTCGAATNAAVINNKSKPAHGLSDAQIGLTTTTNGIDFKPDSTNASDFADDFAETKVKAEKGDAEAQFELGLSYQSGQGVSGDDKEAFKWFSKSAIQGNLDAETEVGGGTFLQ